MQRWTTACVAAGLAVVISAAATPAMAQRPGGQGRGGRGGFGGIGGRAQVSALTAIQAESVQKELAVTEDQKAKVKTLVDDYRTSVRDLFPMGGRGEGERPSAEEREKRMAEFREKSTKLVSEKTTALAAILSGEQMGRLEEIVLQAKGPDALTEPDVQAKLMVSDEQKAKLTSLTEEYREKEREAFRGVFSREGGERGRPDPEAMRAAGEKREAVQKEKLAAMTAVLTPAQAEQFDMLRGKAFAEIDEVRRGGFGGGFGGGRGPGGGRDRGDRPERPSNEN